MIEDRIQAIQSMLEETRNIPGDRKAEFLKLLSDLKTEVSKLGETHQRFSIRGFEGSHPTVVATVGRFASALANMGI